MHGLEFVDGLHDVCIYIYISIRLPGERATFAGKGCGVGGAFSCLGWNLWLDCFIYTTRLPGRPANRAIHTCDGCGKGGAYSLGWNLWMDCMMDAVRRSHLRRRLGYRLSPVLA